MRLRVEEGGYALFLCPACKTPHAINVAPGGWTWNGDADAPVTQPSIRVSRDGQTLCHCYLNGTTIRFCEDSPHELAGKEVHLPEYADVWPDRRPVIDGNASGLVTTHTIGCSDPNCKGC